MNQIYSNIDNFQIELCNVKATIKKCFELVDYEIYFKLKKISKNTNLDWEIISPIQGFELKKVLEKDRKTRIPANKYNQSSGLVKVFIPLDDHITSDNSCEFIVQYQNKLDSEVINKNFLSKAYGVILTRSFGSECLEYNLSVEIENWFYSIQTIIPRFDFVKKRIKCFTDIPTQKPTSVAIIITRKAKAVLLPFGFIFSALAGYYIPKWFEYFLSLINK